MSLSERVFGLLYSFTPGSSNIPSSQTQHNVEAFGAGGQLGSGPDIGPQNVRERQPLDDYEEEYRPPYVHVCFFCRCQLVRLVCGSDGV